LLLYRALCVSRLYSLLLEIIVRNLMNIIMLTKEEVAHIASLSRIELDEIEMERYQKELSDILEYVNTLEKLSTDGVEPIGHITGMVNIYREDKEGVRDEKEREGIIGNIPNRKGDLIRVKKVLN